MMRAWLAVLLLLAGCAGTAPAVQGPPALGTSTPCNANEPPAGYKGPVSPHSVGCAPAWGGTPPPVGVWDYSQGQPPRAVRGQ